MLKQLATNRQLYAVYVLQPPQHSKYKLTIFIRRGDGVVLAQQQDEPKDHMLVVQTSVYNVVSFCSMLVQNTYALNAIQRMIEQRDSKRMTLEEFCKQFDIKLPFPKPP
jgi:hypothetical protein